MKRLMLGLVLTLAAAGLRAQGANEPMALADSGMVLVDTGAAIAVVTVPVAPTKGMVSYYDGVTWNVLTYPGDGQCLTGFGGVPVWGICTGAPAPAVIASAATIAPTAQVSIVSGTTTISTITPPTGWQGGCLFLIPTGVWSTDTTGNITLGTTAVVGKTLTICHDGAKWNPSY